jgi:ADP-ribose pyrophosphatase YjhB (NUDIX family)
VITRQAARAVVYGVFYRLPHGARRRLVRMVVPKFIVGGVVLVRDSEAPAPGRLLLLRQPPGRGWGLPAGLLRRGESPIAGAARELAEETGIRLPPERLEPASPNAIVHVRGWVDCVYQVAVPASTTELVADGAEVWEVKWFPLDNLPRLTLPTARLLAHYGMGPLAGEEDPDAVDMTAAAGPVPEQSREQSRDPAPEPSPGD